jgi:DnaJ-class molecular chaperone
MAVCAVCSGTGLLPRVADASRPLISSYAEVCHRCGGSGALSAADERRQARIAAEAAAKAEVEAEKKE